MVKRNFWQKKKKWWQFADSERRCRSGNKPAKTSNSRRRASRNDFARLLTHYNTEWKLSHSFHNTVFRGRFKNVCVSFAHVFNGNPSYSMELRLLQSRCWLLNTAFKYFSRQTSVFPAGFFFFFVHQEAMKWLKRPLRWVVRSVLLRMPRANGHWLTWKGEKSS